MVQKVNAECAAGVPVVVFERNLLQPTPPIAPAVSARGVAVAEPPAVSQIRNLLLPCDGDRLLAGCRPSCARALAGMREKIFSASGA
jgi:hypothetical protein